MIDSDFAHLKPAAMVADIVTGGAMIIRMPQVEAITGLARPSIYRRLKDDPSFPRSVPLSDSNARCAPVGWVLAEVQGWVHQRMSSRTSN